MDNLVGYSIDEDTEVNKEKRKEEVYLYFFSNINFNIYFSILPNI